MAEILRQQASCVRLVFDSCVFLAYKPKLPSGSLLSVVVIQEMMAGARDRSELREWEATAERFEQVGRLLIPTKEDWLLAGRVLHSLLHGLRSKRTGHLPRLHPDEKQRVIRDVLIARSVRRVNAVLITDNLSDFARIKKYCNVRLRSGREFFRG